MVIKVITYRAVLYLKHVKFYGTPGLVKEVQAQFYAAI